MNFGNLLLRAFKLTGFQTVQWYSAVSNVTNEIGLQVVTWAYPEPVQAQVQPVPRNLFQSLGLDFQKEYVIIYAPVKMNDVTRNRSGDQFVFSAYRYQILSNTEWFPINGWNGQMAVKIELAV